ncbi:MAG: mechanosensitive ion channel domain-containing protein [Bacteroidales bacterium]
MKIQKYILLIFCMYIFHANAQIVNVADKIKQSQNEEYNNKLNASNDSLANEINKLQAKLDSIQEVRNNDAIQRVQANLKQSTDSLVALHQIDSLKKTITPYPIVINNDTIMELYTGLGGKTAQKRADLAENIINKIAEEVNFNVDSLYIINGKYLTDIMYKDITLFSFTESDALFAGCTREELARTLLATVKKQSTELNKEHGFFARLKRIGLFSLVIIGQIIICYLIVRLFRIFSNRADKLKEKRLKPVIIKDYELINIDTELKLIKFLIKGAQYIVILILLVLTVPLLFAIFPQTKKIADLLISYILYPIKELWNGVINFIPNLITIIVIIFVIKYLIKGIEYIASEISAGRLNISGFYPDWALPTANIIRWLLYAFSIVVIYPLIPGAQSDIFKGVSVLVGLIISLGSSSVVGNIMAGLVITYMRAFKIGDRIKLNDTIGNVVEKSAFVTRIRTPKNEIITIPNSFILSSQTTNYSHSARKLGLIIHTSVTIGYDAPWRKVHQLLIDAAKATKGVALSPEPFVLETSLDDYYVSYQVNAVIADADQTPRIMSELHANIQDMFNHSGVEIMSPHYRANRNGNAVTIPEDDLSGFKQNQQQDAPIKDSASNKSNEDSSQDNQSSEDKQQA